MIQAVYAHSVISENVRGTDWGQNHSCLAGSWIKQWYLYIRAMSKLTVTSDYGRLAEKGLKIV
ncbi:protein of unknown function [Acidithiobacillus ferrivorans]|uniref:Uncharacterized protein n=1 Tax=Acidithiobacillus ferrivorans TaxID=160808 RepID=A0A060UMK0_9PROT|nr:hypothetical protein AFERRI_30346 [Acidithiobacillus ferrivorans]SMH67055.1 protein of unknown function [Acidithiobacillus ferrivorans]